jgi:tRNA G37 N-methylase Trm5
MDTYQSRQRIPAPLSAEEVERHAAWILRALCDGVVLHHYRFEPEESLDAVVARLRELAMEAGVRLVVKREELDGRVRYRLRERVVGE